MRINKFEAALISHLGEEKLQQIQQMKVGIAGAGGLGSNCAAHLVRSGFKRLLIVDFDRVECSNLNRQFYFLHQVDRPKVMALEENLRNINPDLELQLHTDKIERSNVAELFAECDVVVEAVDSAAYKTMLVEMLLPHGKFIVSGSGMAGWGSSDEICVHRVCKNLVIVGDLSSEVGENMPPLSPRVNIVAAKQADVVLEYVLGRIV